MRKLKWHLSRILLVMSDKLNASSKHKNILQSAI